MSAADQIRRAEAKARRESLELLFLQHVRAAGLPVPVRNYRFHVERRWMADAGWVDLRLLVEIEGGTRSGGRHVRGDGYEKDCEKYNAAVEQGWMLLRYTGDMVRSGAAVQQVARVIAVIQGKGGAPGYREGPGVGCDRHAGSVSVDHGSPTVTARTR